MLHDVEFIIANKDTEIEALRDQKTGLIKDHQQEIADLNDRLSFFSQNQKLLNDGESENRNTF